MEQARGNVKNSRVYALKFTSSDNSQFYWMQEPSADKDEETCAKINALINGEAPPGDAAPAPEGDLGQLDQNQLLAMLTQGRQRPMDPAAADAAAPAGAAEEAAGEGAQAGGAAAEGAAPAGDAAAPAEEAGAGAGEGEGAAKEGGDKMDVEGAEKK